MSQNGDPPAKPEVVDPFTVAKARIVAAQKVLAMIGMTQINVDFIETLANVNAVAMVLIEKGLTTREDLDLRAARAHAEFLEGIIVKARPSRAERYERKQG
jgi:hypothetical protein